MSTPWTPKKFKRKKNWVKPSADTSTGYYWCTNKINDWVTIGFWNQQHCSFDMIMGSRSSDPSFLEPVYIYPVKLKLPKHVESLPY